MSLTFLIVSIIAGVLTVLAPCILPLIPVVIGTGVGARSKWTPYIVIGSLSVSILIFTYLLKASTLFIDIPTQVWSYISGGVLLLFGLVLLFPSLWDKVPLVGKLSRGSNKLVGAGHQEKSIKGDILIGAALGPVFSSCSPTYFVILAAVLPESFLVGTIYLLGYIAGLAAVLLLITLLGQKLLGRLINLSDDKGWFKRILATIFIILGISIVFGFDKDFEAWLLQNGYLSELILFENDLIESTFEN